MVLTCKEEEGGILNQDKEHREEGSGEEDNEFLFVLCAEKAVWWGVGYRSLRLCWAGMGAGLQGRERGKQRDLHSW
jgi:hypothetical protein